jgi:hypothetical protein
VEWCWSFGVWISFVFEVHVSVTDRLVSGVLVESVSDSDRDVSVLLWVVVTVKVDLEVTIIPSSD